MSDDYRYEIKFVLNEVALSRFISWVYLDTNCRKKYPERIVNSIYFDDLDFSSVSDNIAGVPNRLKTRLRWYQSESMFDKNYEIFRIKEGYGPRLVIPATYA